VNNDPVNWKDLWGLSQSEKTATYLLDNVSVYEERHLENLEKIINASSLVEIGQAYLEMFDNTKEFYLETGKDILGQVELGGKYQQVDIILGQQERHHIPSINALEQAGIDLTKWTGPVVVVDIEDHKQTGSWGNNVASQNYRKEEVELLQNGDFFGAITKGIEDLKGIAIDTGNPNKYDQGIAEMLKYAASIDPSKYKP
jgi:hypothetical protein